MENITPNRIFIGAAGVESHQEFVDLVANKLSFMPSTEGQKTTPRSASSYTGGEVRNLTEGNNLNVALVF